MIVGKDVDLENLEPGVKSSMLVGDNYLSHERNDFVGARYTQQVSAPGTSHMLASSFGRRNGNETTYEAGMNIQTAILVQKERKSQTDVTESKATKKDSHS